MSRFELLLFLHISMAVIWVGGALMIQFFGVRAMQSGDPGRMATLGEDIEWIAKRVFVPSSLIAFLTGVLLVADEAIFRWSDDWIVLGLLLYATTFFAGLLFLSPESGRIAKLAAEGSPDTAPRTARLVMLTRLDLVLLFFVIFVMTIKPEIDDQALLEGLATAVLAGGLVYWRYRVALSPALAGSE